MFCRSRLKVLFVGSKFQFLRVWLKNLGKHRLDPQNAHPCAKWRVLTCHWFVRVLCIFHRLNMGNGGPQLSHQTSQDTPTSKRQPFGPSIHHGITGSILQCKPMGCRLITGRYVLGISYGKIGKNAKIGEVWRLPVALKTLFWVTSQNASWLQLVSRQCGWSWLTMKATYKRLCPGWKKKPETWPTRFLSQDRGSKSWLRRSIATAH